MPLEYFTEIDAKELQPDAEDLIAAATNQDAAWYREAKLPFPEILAHEKAYLVRRLMDDLKQIAKEMWNDYPEYRDVNKLPPEVKKPDFDPWISPSIQVLAGVNAALISSGKKFSGNDILDFQHAALAVPYCDALVCDRRMANTLINKPLEFNKVYETKILSRPDEIKTYLQELL